MRSSLVGRLIVLCALLALPVAAYAQEAVLSGTVTDSTGAVLPGVSVKAVHEASGNTFEAVTDQRGAYRMSVRIGGYVITAQLSGFTTVTRRGVELLVGDTAVIDMRMGLTAVAETVTVTAEAPLIETTKSSVGGTIDPRQMQELPSQGRNWMSLALLAPGNRTNAQGALPVQDRVDVREFQLNVDGMQVTSNLGTGNQSRYSNDSIAEFQFISNRFDATQGRSSGVQVNAITKSGTNTFSGSLVGNFRDSKFNAEDPVLLQVLPYSNQQISGTFGGPIVQNKLHFFANYEYERQPLTSIWQHAVPGVQRRAEWHPKRQAGRRAGGRAAVAEDASDGKGVPFTSVRAVWSGHRQPSSATNSNEEHNTDVLGSFTQVLSNRALNEFRVGIRLLRHQPDESDELVEALAGGQRHHDRRTGHQVQGLFVQPQRQPAAISRSGRVHRPRRFHVFLRRGRPSRSEGGR